MFQLDGGTLSGTIDGGGSNDTLIADDGVATSFTITGMDQGTMTGLGGGFSDIENLTGGDSTDDTCPAGAHEVDQGDGTYQCVESSGIACLGSSDLDVCSYSWGANTITGTCYAGGCVADCSIAGNDCANANSVCQATGVVGDGATDYVCLPDDTFTADDTCPAGTHEMAQGDGTYQCVAPSGIACLGKSDQDV